MGNSTSLSRRPDSDHDGDPVFDAACDLLIASKHLETQAMNRPHAAIRIAATLNVLGSTLATLQSALGHVSDRGPGIPNDREIHGVMRTVRRALGEATGACDRGHTFASRESTSGEGAPQKPSAQKQPITRMG